MRVPSKSKKAPISGPFGPALIAAMASAVLMCCPQALNRDSCCVGCLPPAGRSARRRRRSGGFDALRRRGPLLALSGLAELRSVGRKRIRRKWAFGSCEGSRSQHKILAQRAEGAYRFLSSRSTWSARASRGLNPDQRGDRPNLRPDTRYPHKRDGDAECARGLLARNIQPLWLGIRRPSTLSPCLLIIKS